MNTLALPELLADSWKLFRFLVLALNYAPEQAAEIAEEWLRRATGGMRG
jgi:hypothetical protein